MQANPIKELKNIIKPEAVLNYVPIWPLIV